VQAPAPTIESVINALSFRNIGPFRTAAWVTSIAVPESPAHDHLYTIYASSRSGGCGRRRTRARRGRRF
jgi:hypothetical protein